jgi:hypothetical protein
LILKPTSGTCTSQNFQDSTTLKLLPLPPLIAQKIGMAEEKFPAGNGSSDLPYLGKISSSPSSFPVLGEDFFSNSNPTKEFFLYPISDPNSTRNPYPMPDPNPTLAERGAIVLLYFLLIGPITNPHREIGTGDAILYPIT